MVDDDESVKETLTSMIEKEMKQVKDKIDYNQ